MNEKIDRFINIFNNELISQIENANEFQITNISTFLENLKRLKENPNSVTLDELITIGNVISALKNNFLNIGTLSENKEIINDLDQWIGTMIIEKQYPQLTSMTEATSISQTPSISEEQPAIDDEPVEIQLDPSIAQELDANQPKMPRMPTPRTPQPILNPQEPFIPQNETFQQQPPLYGQRPVKMPEMPRMRQEVQKHQPMPNSWQPAYNYGSMFPYPQFSPQMMQQFIDMMVQQMTPLITQAVNQALAQQTAINNPAQQNITRDTIDARVGAVEAIIANLENRVEKKHGNIPIKIDNMLEHQDEIQIRETKEIIAKLRACDLSTQDGQKEAEKALEALNQKRAQLEKLQPTLLIRKVTELLYRLDKQATFEPDFRDNVRTLINEVQHGNMTKLSELEQAYQRIESKYVEVYGERKARLEKEQQEAAERYRIYEKPFEKQMQKKQQKLEKKQDKLIQGKKYDGFVQDSPLLEKFSDQLRDAERQFGRNSEEYQARAQQFYDYAQANLGKRMMKKLQKSQLILNGGNQIIIQTHLLEQSTSALHR